MSEANENWSRAYRLHQQGKLREAFLRYDAIAKATPGHAPTLHYSGVVLYQSGKLDAAIERIRASLAIDPQEASAWSNLAIALWASGRREAALDAFVEAARLAPDSSTIHANLDSALMLSGRHTEVEASARLLAAYEQALSVEPDNGAALGQLTFLRGKLADWRDRAQLVKRYRDGVHAAMPGLSPFALLSLPSTRAEQRKCAETWTAALADAEPMSRRGVLSTGRLRIGYLCADFHSHATACLAAGLIERHDRARFEIVGYSPGADHRSPTRARIERAFDRFVDVRDRDPLAVADIIRRDAVDILVDLDGHTQDATPIVLARRPAPIQVHYLGYPGTLGTTLVDYLIGDAIVTPVEHWSDYAETIAVLPDACQINDRERLVGEPPPRGALGLPQAGTVFCSFSQTYKINPQVFDAWASILKSVPDSVLWLLARSDDDPAIGNLRREAEVRRIDAKRLVFARRRASAEYLALYRHADLFLDTWPYNAHTTASDSLWAGCPVLTTLGATFAGRVTSSLLNAVGLSELVTATADEYIARAIALARDRDELMLLKAYLAGPGRASPLFDTARTTRALEAAYIAMAEQFRQGVRKPFRVHAIPTNSPG